MLEWVLRVSTINYRIPPPPRYMSIEMQYCKFIKMIPKIPKPQRSFMSDNKVHSCFLITYVRLWPSIVLHEQLLQEYAPGT